MIPLVPSCVDLAETSRGGRWRPWRRGLLCILTLVLASLCHAAWAQEPVTPTATPVPAPAAVQAPQTAQAQQADLPSRASTHPSVHVHEAIGPIEIDGKLSEPDWAQAEPMVLTQQSPYEGQPTPYRTEVRVLIYRDALIFGFHCYDPNPKAIQVHTLQYDGVADDDSVSVLLDTFGDRRTGYLFQINPAGARFDGLISGLGSFSTDWDGIWNAKTARTPDGWSAEFWIPAQTLKFVGGSSRWGLQLDRSIARDQTELRWASPTLDSNLYDMSRAGDMELVSVLKQGLGLEFAPYARGTMDHNFDPAERNWPGSGGGEITWRITPQLAAILTVNTDFAETEVDSRQIDITPWPLLFPEKRAFFLEGANLYTFGLGLDASFVPFFSRNVGLLDGFDIPLYGGVKLDGHVGPWSLAFLDAETRRTYVPSYVVNDLALPAAKVEGTNLLASRVAYDVDKHLRVGAIATHGDPEAQLDNTMVGADAVWNTPNFLGNHSLQFGGWAATTQGQVPAGSRQAWGVRATYPSDAIYFTAGTNRFGDGFDPLLSFLPRPQTNQSDVDLQLTQRPSQKGSLRDIRQTFESFSLSRVTDTQGNVQSQLYTIYPLSIVMKSGDELTTTVYVDHEVLTSPFSVVPSVTYPVGSYDFQRYGFTFQSSPQRSLSFMNASFFGSYYNGHLYHQNNSLNWTALRGKFESTATSNIYFAHTPQGDFVEKLWQFKSALSWSPDLSLTTFVQYDNVSFDLSSNTRLRWTFRPGDDFYVIWDRTWERNLSHPGINLENGAESVTAKVQWTFRPRR